MTGALTRYDAVRHALAECVRIDEAKDIVDKTVALAAYARQAEDRELEANAVELRERATRRLGELIIETKATVGLSKGGRPKTSSNSEQVSGDAPQPPKLSEIGVSRKLSSDAQRKAAMPKREFEQRLTRMHQRVGEGKAPDIAFREQDREQYRANARTLAQGLSDAMALKPEGRRFPCAYADPAWRRKAGFGDRAYENHYGTMGWDEILAMPVKERLLPDAWLYLWIPRAHLLALHPVEVDTPIGRTTVKMPLAWAVAQAWGFDAYSTCFVWTKTDEEAPDAHGTGLIAWDQDEILCLFKRGRGLPMPAAAEKFGSNHRERAGRHSEKPAFYRDMINTMTGGVPVLELFAREDAEHVLPPNFFTWGAGSKNTAELPPHDPDTGAITESGIGHGEEAAIAPDAGEAGSTSHPGGNHETLALSQLANTSIEDEATAAGEASPADDPAADREPAAIEPDEDFEDIPDTIKRVTLTEAERRTLARVDIVYLSKSEELFIALLRKDPGLATVANRKRLLAIATAQGLISEDAA